MAFNQLNSPIFVPQKIWKWTKKKLKLNRVTFRQFCFGIVIHLFIPKYFFRHLSAHLFVRAFCCCIESLIISKKRRREHIDDLSVLDSNLKHFSSFRRNVVCLCVCKYDKNTSLTNLNSKMSSLFQVKYLAKLWD